MRLLRMIAPSAGVFQPMPIPLPRRLAIDW